MAFGRHKMCPSISPKKSWEGLCGSMLFSAAVACGFYALSGRFGWAEDVPLWGMLSYPLAAGAGAGIGANIAGARYQPIFEGGVRYFR